MLAAPPREIALPVLIDGGVRAGSARKNEPGIGHWSQRRTFHPGSLPRHMAVNVLDLDVTKNCNLRCGYCFKSTKVRPRAVSMSLDTTMAAVDWLIAASYGANDLWVHLMGGEPLLAFPVIEKLVPYAKRRCAAAGKTVQFGCTTNLTLVNDRITAFFRRWGMGWHCSTDGLPEVQNRQRPGVGGRESAARAERGFKLILRDRPGAMARATVTPETVARMFDSFRYFEAQGFRTMGFAVADEPCWTDGDLDELDRQLERIRGYVRDNWYRKGIDRSFAAFDFIIRAEFSKEQRLFGCGAGRGTVLVDERGDLWPCHRWDGGDLDSGAGGGWRFGNIFEDGFNHALHLALLERDRWACQQPACASCPAKRICAGGCPASNIVYSGSAYYQDRTNCRVTRIYYRHAMLLHHELFAEKNPLFVKKFYSGTHKPLDSFTEAPYN